MNRRRMRLLLGATAGVALSALLLVVTRPAVEPVPPGGRLVLPPAAGPYRDSADVTTADFLGSDACAGCHREQFAAWSASTHGRAGGPPEAGRVVAPFDGTPIVFRDAEVVPTRRGAQWVFVVRQARRPDRVLTVDGVVGGGHMAGGGTQGFVSRQPDGTVRFLPFDFIRQEGGGVWFCNTNSRANVGWVPITPSLPLAGCGDWPPARVLGDEVRYANCQACHGSQIAVSLDSVAGGYRTTWTSLAVNCESCHGPGRPHLAAVQDSARLARGDVALPALAVLGKDASLGTCWQCHALKDQLRGGFLPGRRFEAYYSTHLAQLGDAAHFPDGRVRTFAYQQGHLSSDCYVNGGMTCTSCHDPHSQAYRDVQGRALVGRFDNRQCTSCHASKAEAPERHTKHGAGSEGSRCTSCHMPYLQEPEIGATLRYARSDHAIPVPRPLADSALGVVSACRACHADRAESVLEAQVRAWYGEAKPVNPAIASVMSWRDADRMDVAAPKLLVTGSNHSAATVAGLSRFIENYVVPDRPEVERVSRARLGELVRHPDLDVRALALASLHALWGERADVRRLLATALDTAGADAALLRSRWAVVLGWLADDSRTSGDPLDAVTIYRKALEVEVDNPRLHLNLGLALYDARRAGDAVASYRESLRLRPPQPLALVNMGIALASQGDFAPAAAAYGEALRLNPREALAHFNLGNLQVQQDHFAAAEQSYRLAVDADGSLAPAHWYLARLLLRRGELSGALREVEATLEFDRGHDEARAAREQLLRVGARP